MEAGGLAYGSLLHQSNSVFGGQAIFFTASL